LPSGRRSAIELPFALLTVAIAIIFAIATLDTWRQRSNLQKLRQQLATAYHEREPMREQSKNVQQALEKIVRDLLKLAATDADAQAIVTKYGIQLNEPSAPQGEGVTQ